MKDKNKQMYSDIIVFSGLEEEFQKRKEKIANSILKDIMKKPELSFYKRYIDKAQKFSSKKYEQEHVEITLDNINTMFDKMFLFAELENKYRINKERALAKLLENNLSEEELHNNKYLIQDLKNFKHEL